MKNNENKKETKYYIVSLSDGTKTIVSDGYENSKTTFNKLLNVYAVLEDGRLSTLLGGKLILDRNDANKNYNSNVFDVVTFIKDGYSLFGVEKQEISPGELENEISIKYNTQEKVRKASEAIVDLETKTKEEAMRQYDEIIEAERSFSEEINKGRRK